MLLQDWIRYRNSQYYSMCVTANSHNFVFYRKIDVSFGRWVGYAASKYVILDIVV